MNRAREASTDTLVAGVDGCKAGWVIVAVDGQLAPTNASGAVTRTLREALQLLNDYGAVVLDVPIGLLDRSASGGRKTDIEARTLLTGKSSSVFSAPTRPVLEENTWERANTLAKSSSPDSVGITRQAFAIFPKIREADELMTPDLQKRIVEGHPELSFMALNHDDPVSLPKRSAGGMLLRFRLLERAGFRSAAEHAAERAGKGAQMDDVLDATALAWSAARFAAGAAERVPDDPPADAKGLRMEMWF